MAQNNNQRSSRASSSRVDAIIKDPTKYFSDARARAVREAEHSLRAKRRFKQA